MKIAVVTVGTRGDMQPLAAIALGLAARGHEVRVATGSREQEWFEALGLDWREVDDRVIRDSDANRFREEIEASGRLAATWRHSTAILRNHREQIHRLLDSAWDAVRDADAIVSRLPLAMETCFADGLRIPCVHIELMPQFCPTREFPSYALPALPLGGAYNRLSYHLFRLTAWPVVSAVDAWARKRNLPVHPRRFAHFDPAPVHWVHCFSKLVVPRPRDWSDDWHMTGFCFLDEPSDFHPPADLAHFLAQGPRPVYLGFGSLARHAERVTQIVCEAVARSGRRAILATGRGGLSPTNVPPDAFVIEGAPHSWLFPRMDAVVHHGGAGTTAAGLLAGVPSVLCPFQGDQFFWGRRIEQLGLGPAPIPQSRLTAEALVAAIERVTTDEAMRRRAAELGRGLRSERGLEETLDLIERLVLDPRPRRA